MDANLVFQRTEQGQGALTQPGAALPAKLRRCLFLVDGKTPVADLAPMFRPGEIGAILQELADAGYVRKAG